MSERLGVCAAVLIICTVLGGCGGGGGGHLLEYMWEVDEPVQAVNGWLTLTSSTGKGAEIQSVRQDLLCGSLEFRAKIANWATDTSLGYESFVGLHRAIIVTGGVSQGPVPPAGEPLGHFAIINPAGREAHIPIPDFEKIKDQINTFRIVWAADSALLYINNDLKVTYKWDGSPGLPSVPDASLGIRLNASNDFADEVEVDHVIARDANGNVIIDEDFTQLCGSAWMIVKGSSAAACNSWLELISKGPGEGSQIQSKRLWQEGVLEIKAESANWASDTTIGMELWAIAGYYGIVVAQREVQEEPQEVLRVSSPAGTTSVPIENWDSIKLQANVFRFVWEGNQVQLYVNGSEVASYQGADIPDVPMKVRLNASNNIADELRVDYVILQQGGREVFQDHFPSLYWIRI